MTNEEFLHAIQATAKSETETFLKEPATKKLLKELKVQYGNDNDGFMKARMKVMMPLMRSLPEILHGRRPACIHVR